MRRRNRSSNRIWLRRVVGQVTKGGGDSVGATCAKAVGDVEEDVEAGEEEEEEDNGGARQ